MGRSRLGLCAAVFILALLATACPGQGSGPLRIGVLLPFSGPDAEDFRLPLRFALDAVNASGVDGRRVELVEKDIGTTNIDNDAQVFADDPSILAVIGPDTSRRAYSVASTFVEAKKVLVTPSATSADLFRAFSKYGTFWRTVESDVAQARVLLDLAKRGGAKRVALLTPDDDYGDTFFTWFGFVATEDGLTADIPVRYNASDPGCASSVDQALRGHPDALIAVPSSGDQTVCIARATAGKTRVLFSDAAQDLQAIRRLGNAADGLEGTGLSSDPKNGFDAAFTKRFGKPPTPYAANVYDALTLIAYGLEASGGDGGEALADGMRTIVEGHGPVTSWDAKGVARALKLIRDHRTPDLNGATGPLRFDAGTHTDLVSSTYSHWRVEHGTFHVLEHISTAHRQDTSVDRPTAAHETLGTSTTNYRPAARSGVWAVIVAASSGWENYRHQADALAQYQMLRERGVRADHIILIEADDLAHDPQNKHPGVIRNIVGGPNVNAHVHVDYKLRDVTPSDVLAILSGQQSARTPSVVRSTARDDVYFFLVGHGNEQGVFFGLNEPVPPPGKHFRVLSPDDLARTTAQMYAQHRYRRLFIAVESCHSGTLGSKLATPGVFLLTAATATENSLSQNYDPEERIWLADEFAYSLWRTETDHPDESLRRVYERVYLGVAGSHVSAYAPAFGSALAVPVSDFITP